MGNASILFISLFGGGILLLSLLMGGAMGFLVTNFEQNKVALLQKADVSALNRLTGLRQDRMVILGKRIGKIGSLIVNLLLAVLILGAVVAYTAYLISLK